MKLLLVAVALAGLALGGCSAPSLALDAQWAPLTSVVEDPTKLQGANTNATTIETMMFVPDLTRFEANYPDGSVARSALLTHEREHARRQLAAGGVDWLFHYLTEPSFRWAEEQIGWRLEIQAHMAVGDRIDAEGIADSLADDYMGMVDRATALAWVQSVLRGE